MDLANTRIRDASVVTEKDARNAAWVCFLAWTFAVYDFILFGSLLPKLAESYGWSPSYATGVNTWITIGTALVALGVGPMVDKLGRRRGIAVAVIGAATASAMTAVTGWVIGIIAGVGVTLLILVRSIAGLGYAEQAINATYLNEMFAHVYGDTGKVRHRGLIYSLVQSGFCFGAVLAAVSIYVLFPLGGAPLCFIVGIFPALFMLWAIRYLKESPQFVRHRQARQLLRQRDAQQINALDDFAELDGTSASAPFLAAFKGESLRPTIVLSLAFYLIWFGNLVFGILGTSVLSSPEGKHIAFDGALEVLIISNASSILGFVLFGWLGDRIGRRNTISVGWLLSALCFTAMLYASSNDYALIIALYSLGLFLMYGPFSAVLFFAGESFPVHTRATGNAIVAASGQLGAVTAGALITSSLASGVGWIHTALIWGAAPTLVAGVIILCARNISPHTVREL